MTIENVKELLGEPYRTLTGAELSPVFYEAVQEYRYVAANGNYSALVNFTVSEETVLKTAQNIRQLAVKLNNGEEIQDLDTLPVKLHQLFSSKSIDFILATAVPVQGTVAHQKYVNNKNQFKATLTNIIMKAYGIPQKNLAPEEYYRVAMNFAVGGDEEKGKQLLAVTKKEARLKN